MMPAAVVLLMVFLIFLPAGAMGADARNDLKGIQKEIKKKELLLNTTKKIERQVSGELTAINKGLRAKEIELNRLTADLKKLDQEIILTRQKTQSTQGEVDRKQIDIQRRLVALYKAGDTGPVRTFFSSGSFPQMMESLRYMQSILLSDRKMVDDYATRIKTLTYLKTKLEDDARHKEALRSGIEAKKREIEVEKQRKAEYLVKVRKDRDVYAASIKELEANAARLQAMMQKLEAKSRKTSKVKPGHSLPKSTQQQPSIPLTPVPSTGFGARKRQLTLPVKGEIVQRFGKHKHSEFNSFTFSNGLSITAPSGADIHAIDSGTVIFANYFKGYGNMAIVDHGDGFFSVYAHASHLVKKEGSSVSRNEVIASVGDVDSIRGSMLYFEIRYQGKPVDPSPWFK